MIENERITAVNVFVEIDGEQFMAMIDPDLAALFVHMLPAVQSGDLLEPKFYKLPAKVAEPLAKVREALYDVLMKPKGATLPAAAAEPTREEIAALRAEHGITSSGRGVKEFEQVDAFVRAVLQRWGAAPPAPAAPGIDQLLDALSQHDDPCDDIADALDRVRALRAEVDRLTHAEKSVPSATTLNVLRVALERAGMPRRATGFMDHEIATAAEWVRAAQVKKGGA